MTHGGSHIHQATIPALEIAVESWLFAQTCPLLGCTGLLVYRSPLLRDTDSECAPLVEFLESFDTELLITERVIDPDMYFGRADLLLYRVGSHTNPCTQSYEPVHIIFSEESLATRLLDVN